MTDEEVAQLTWTELVELINKLLEELTLRYMTKDDKT